MKNVIGLGMAVAMLFVSSAVAEDIESGLKVGSRIGAFNVTKCAGAPEDGIEVGDNLCYRCKNGGRPQVMVFTRSGDEKVVSLVKKLDDQLKKHSDAQLRAFVNVLSDSKDVASDEAKKLAESTKAKEIPFVVPNEFENGPEDYGINPKAELTIVFANESKVVANYAVKSAKELDVKKFLTVVEKALN